MTAKKVIDIRFTGPELTLEKVRARDIAEIIESVEDMITHAVTQDHPDMKEEDLIVAFVGLESGSVQLQFLPTHPEIALAAFSRIAESIAENDLGDLPRSTVKSINTISSFVRKHKCTAELRVPVDQPEPLAVITPDVKIEPTPIFSGQTTLFGEVMRVGGKQPKVMIRTMDEQVVYCDIDMELAKELGHRLYGRVGLFGTAEWDVKKQALEGFHIEDLTTYEHTPISKAVEKLSEIIGKYFDSIDDVEGYISRIRGRHLEE